MQYRKFGSIDFQVSALGFGAMRLPVIAEDSGKIDEKNALKMLHYAIEQGVNYIDTAYPYHDGQSEPFVGKALSQDGYRNKVKIATKMPCWLIQEPGDCEKYLDEQLAKLQTDHIDFYLLHALFSERWQSMKHHRVLDWAEQAVQKGKIGHIGFSFHDSFKLFKEIVDSYDQWGLCQIQYNYMNEDVQAGMRGLQYAADKGIAVVIMEPLLGGILANPPMTIQKVFEDYEANPADIALRWLWNKPEVACVLSGMSDFEQVEKNLRYAEKSGIGKLTAVEDKLVDEVKARFRAKNLIPCTKCRYCMPCPNQVNIPHNFELYNQAFIYEEDSLSRTHYNYHTPEAHKASACVQCKICEEKCPQHIKISDWMPKIHRDLAF